MGFLQNSLRIDWILLFYLNCRDGLCSAMLDKSVYELHTLIMWMNILRFIASNTFRFRIIMNLTIVKIGIGNTFYFIVHVHILFSYVHLCNIVCLDYLLFAEHMRILCAISTFFIPPSLSLVRFHDFMDQQQNEHELLTITKNEKYFVYQLEWYFQ